MKNLRIAGFLVVCSFFATNALKAQVQPPLNNPVTNKPLLFAQLGNKFNCNITALDQLFNSTVGASLHIALSDHLALTGTINSITSNAPGATSINFKSSNYPGAIFTITRITENDQQIRYIGRIMSIQHGDILLLQKENDGYVFTKQVQYAVMEE